MKPDIKIFLCLIPTNFRYRAFIISIMILYFASNCLVGFAKNNMMWIHPLNISGFDVFLKIFSNQKAKSNRKILSIT